MSIPDSTKFSSGIEEALDYIKHGRVSDIGDIDEYFEKLQTEFEQEKFKSSYEEAMDDIKHGRVYGPFQSGEVLIKACGIDTDKL